MIALAITATILGLLAGAGWGLAAALWCDRAGLVHLPWAGGPRQPPLADDDEDDLAGADPDQLVRSCLPDEWRAERGASSFRPPGGHPPPAAGPRPTRPPRRPPAPGRDW